MAEMQTMRFTGEHWLILDAIAKSPSGIATTAEIQTHFGCRGMAEPLEELFDAGVICNTYSVPIGNQPAKRNPHKFEMTPPGTAVYTKRRNAEGDRAIKAAHARWKTEEQGVHDEWVEEDKPRGPGRPPGSKNKPKAESAGVE